MGLSPEIGLGMAKKTRSWFVDSVEELAGCSLGLPHLALAE